MYEKFSSIIYHVINRHEWGGCKYFKQCAHEPYPPNLERERKWMVEGSEAHAFLVSLVKDKSLKKDMEYLTEAIHTTNVEVFNNLLLKYIPKQYHFQYDHMVMGAYLTALENNFNADRGVELLPNGETKYKIAWRKPTHKYIARKVYKKKRYDYLCIMKYSVYKRAANCERHISRKRVMAPGMVCGQRNEIVSRAKKLARFSQ